MLFNWTRRTAPADPTPADAERWRLTDLEAAQRRDPYAAGDGARRRRANAPARLLIPRR